MQNILEQLLKVVLALTALITAYLTGKGVITTQGVAQNAVSVETQAVSAITQTQTAVTTPTTPTVPGRISQQARSQSQQANITDAAAANATVSVAGVTSLKTTDATATTVDTQVATTTDIITDSSAYGVGSYVAEGIVDGAIYVATTGADGNAGTKEAPFATVQKALDVVQPGQTIYIRGGTYPLKERIVTKRGGTEGMWVTVMGYPGEKVVFDATDMSLGTIQYGHDYGAFWITNDVAYMRVANMTIINSPGSGFSVCRGKSIVIEGNMVNGSYTPGISANSTYNHDCKSEDIKILRNTLTNTNNLAFGRGAENSGEAPHEAISIMGTDGFEVAYNHIYETNKEGIDVKERSRNGVVHHNLVENIARQCFYVDAWYGTLENIEWFNNIGRNCGFMGFAISVENGSSEAAVASNISFHHNLLDSPQGTGIYFSRFNADGLRKNIKIYNNTLYNAGHNVGWIIGGLALLSDNIEDAQIYDNIFVNNAPFQMGASAEYGGMAGLQQRNVVIKNNIINGPQNGGDMMDGSMQPIDGIDTIIADPLFTNPEGGDFTLRAGSPAIGTATDGGNIGAF